MINLAFVDTLDKALPPLCEKRSFRVLGKGTERHGSWQWAFGKESSGLKRFVFVTLTPLPQLAEGTETWGSVQFWSAAEYKNRFERLSDGELRARFGSLDGSGAFAQGLERAMIHADTLEEAELTDSYVSIPKRVKIERRPLPG